MKVLNQVDIKKLTKLNQLLDLNIRYGLTIGKENLCILQSRERLAIVETAVMSAAIALSIMSSYKMPIDTYDPDLLEKCADILKQQLYKTIYPECDLIYARKELDSSKNKKKKNKHQDLGDQDPDDQEYSGRQGKTKNSESVSNFISTAERYSGKRQSWKGQNYKKMSKLYNACIEIFDQLALILQKPIVFGQESFILKVNTVSTGVFIVENIPELQYSSLLVCTSIYKGVGNDFKKSILEEIFVHLNHLPQSKKTKRQFKLRKYGKVLNKTDLESTFSKPENEDPQHSNFEETQHIQMFTVLMLLFIQSLVNRCRSTSNYEVNNDEDVVKGYRKAKHLARQFLIKLLQKRKEKTEDFDFKLLFDDVVQDLLMCVNRPEWPAAEMMLVILGRLLAEYFGTRTLDSSLRVGALDSLGSVARKLREDQIEAAEMAKTGQFDSLINGIMEHFTDLKENDELLEIGQQWKDMASANRINSSNLSGNFIDYKKGETNTLNMLVKDKQLQTLTSHLQTVLIQHLTYNSSIDSLLRYSVNFNIGRWLDNVITIEDKLLKLTQQDSDDSEMDENSDDDEEYNRMSKKEKRKALVVRVLNWMS